MKIIIALILFVYSTSLAFSQKGEIVEIYLKDHNVVKGELYSVAEDEITILNFKRTRSVNNQKRKKLRYLISQKRLILL